MDSIFTDCAVWSWPGLNHPVVIATVELVKIEEILTGKCLCIYYPEMSVKMFSGKLLLILICVLLILKYLTDHLLCSVHYFKCYIKYQPFVLPRWCANIILFHVRDLSSHACGISGGFWMKSVKALNFEGLILKYSKIES